MKLLTPHRNLLSPFSVVCIFPKACLPFQDSKIGKHYHVVYCTSFTQSSLWHPCHVLYVLWLFDGMDNSLAKSAVPKKCPLLLLGLSLQILTQTYPTVSVPGVICPFLRPPFFKARGLEGNMEFSRQKHWRLPFPSPGDLPDPGIKPGSPALQLDSSPSELPGKLQKSIR